MIYDTTLKDLLWRGAPGLLNQLVGTTAVTITPTEFSSTRKRVPDFIADLADRRVLHLELQGDPDLRMDWRMLEYYGPIAEAKGGAPIVQIVLALTDAVAAAMPRTIEHPNLSFRFAVVSFESLDPDRLLASPRPDDHVLAILCRTDDMRARVRDILNRLTILDENERSDAVARLMILAGIKRAAAVVEEEAAAMGLEIDINENEFLRTVYDKGRAAPLLYVLEERFGAPVPEPIRMRIQAASVQQIARWMAAALKADDLDAVFHGPAH